MKYSGANLMTVLEGSGVLWVGVETSVAETPAAGQSWLEILEPPKVVEEISEMEQEGWETPAVYLSVIDQFDCWK